MCGCSNDEMMIFAATNCKLRDKIFGQQEGMVNDEAKNRGEIFSQGCNAKKTTLISLCH